MRFHIIVALLLGIFPLRAQELIALGTSQFQITWQNGPQGWRIASVQTADNGRRIPFGTPSGEYTVLYSAGKPDKTPVQVLSDGKAVNFPEPVYKYLTNTWAVATAPVPMNTAGTAWHFFPQKARPGEGGRLIFEEENDAANIKAEWALDPKFINDVVVKLTLTARQPGFFSMASPTLGIIQPSEINWGIVPGQWQGNAIQTNFVLAYAYGEGIPNRPVIARDRTCTTLAPLLNIKSGATLAVIPEPGTARDPWANDTNTHGVWKLGLSLMNRKGQLTPTAYAPVLGEEGSLLKAGETATFHFRYTLQVTDWFTVYKHAILDIYKLEDFLALKQTKQSLINRVEAMSRYVLDDKTSMWRTEDFGGVKIGAQAYMGGVVGSDGDAMKNSDYGAMWLMAYVTEDQTLRKTRLPYARNFKLAQIEKEPGFFQGAAIGQYYLSKGKRFTEEWGPYVEPVALTYYTMLDAGNVLLFEPNDNELRDRLRMGAERLLEWQHPDGHWEVAYDRATRQPVFTDLTDLRPTFYGLYVAHRILGDKKYLDAARKGAGWFCDNAVAKGHFLGVCGDARFANDFATGESAQALLDLYAATGDARYRDAAVNVARIYTASIYTHPVATKQIKQVNGKPRADWEISQVGLSFEHGGTIGSANSSGPIQLCSHAGMFLRIHELTGDPLFRDLARAGALGRDAFVDPKTSVASYYWARMDLGAGPYPHHAWWQIGWIMDYLLAETHLRSGGKIDFPRGFITPKVGPHQTYGFAPGTVFGEISHLKMPPGLVTAESPYLDCLSAFSTRGNRVFVIALNNSGNELTSKLKIDPAHVLPERTVRWIQARPISGKAAPADPYGNWNVTIPPYGLAVIQLTFQL